MASLDDIPGFLTSDDPHSWAEEHLSLVGQGDTARVYAHPEFPDLVVRISDYPDGWFAYAMALAGIAEGDPAPGVASALGRHAPDVHDMRYAGRGDAEAFVGISGRLTLADRDGDDVLISAARAVLLTDHPPCLDSDDGALAAHAAEWAAAAVEAGHVSEADAAELLRAQPALLAMAQALPAGFRDLRDTNWMRRGEHLVLNDPTRAMRPEVEARFKESYGVPDGSPSPAP